MKHEKAYFAGYSSGTHKYDAIADAQTECLKRSGKFLFLIQILGTKNKGIRESFEIRKQIIQFSIYYRIKLTLRTPHPNTQAYHQYGYLLNVQPFQFQMSIPSKYPCPQNAKIEPLKSLFPDCGGLTYEPTSKKYTLRKGTSVTNSGGETSYTKPGIRQFSLLFCHVHKNF